MHTFLVYVFNVQPPLLSSPLVSSPLLCTPLFPLYIALSPLQQHTYHRSFRRVIPH